MAATSSSGTSARLIGLTRSITTPRSPLPPKHLSPSFNPSSLSELAISQLNQSPPPISALAAFNSRLNLNLPLNLLEQSFIHPSFWSLKSHLLNTHFHNQSRSSNAPLAALGNSILGTLTAELLLSSFPHLPTRVTKAATSLYVGPKSLAQVAEKKWGVAPGRLEHQLVKSDENLDLRKMDRRDRSYGHLIEGVGGARKRKGSEKEGAAGGGLVRWDRTPVDPVADSILYEAALSSVSRSIVGALHLTHGFAVTRSFIHSHFLSRLLSTTSLPSPQSTSDLTPLLKFTSPTLLLSRTLALYSLPTPTHRLLKESGRLSAHPTFLTGVFSGDKKLGEGFGSSLKMSQWRASEDALRRVYLGGGVGIDGTSGLPSDTWVEGIESSFKGLAFGEVEAPEESSR